MIIEAAEIISILATLAILAIAERKGVTKI